MSVFRVTYQASVLLNITRIVASHKPRDQCCLAVAYSYITNTQFFCANLGAVCRWIRKEIFSVQCEKLNVKISFFHSFFLKGLRTVYKSTDANIMS